ncbi:hypothetical protein AHMF7605_20780 [Adhaeribacter arboris]|uniref:Uncharacterized protein n=1 Tax=Adhaeribacter arboris TaxID=2072846 RepID=A0A2T2YJR7_9BACT|nr:hypothetical protein [Adhaeribacter arboris]PSR55763.1 hypothetical protein AHMF7605_20780 [Adhaeribacter arboris]
MNLENPSQLAFRKTVVRLLAANLFVLIVTCFISFMSLKEANRAASNANGAKIMSAQLKYRLIKKGVIEKKDDMSTDEAIKEILFLTEEHQHRVSNY